MKEIDKQDAYKKWKNDDRGHKPDVRFVIRNGLPPSMSAWAQEYGRAGRDSKQAHAYILYCNNDIQHVGFWTQDISRYG